MDPLEESVRALLMQSLLAWRLAGNVGRAGDGAIFVACNGIDILIERAPTDVPFRWLVTVDGRRRVALAIPALLRQVRTALDPGYARDTVRVAVAPLI